ncbi:hypothetical protein MRX96_009116 [Rhipicephalus microplus]|uniref:Uncharacterized protein n=1 Tax=Rhipicephalus microplus TaxID=6941 RepID=A0A9J6DTS1_RHIMP|nr:hypothetical protein HPB51_006033 [Rhipicephalus microplus]
MLHSTFSGQEPLLHSQLQKSLVHHTWKSRITMMVPAGSLALTMISVVVVGLRHLPERQAVVNLQHPAMAWLALAPVSIDNFNVSESAVSGSFPARASDAVGRREALLGFVLCESNKMGVRWAGDDYDELDYI